jgi:hypothetical protein
MLHLIVWQILTDVSGEVTAYIITDHLNVWRRNFFWSSVDIYQTTRCNIPADSRLQRRPCSVQFWYVDTQPCLTYAGFLHVQQVRSHPTSDPGYRRLSQKGKRPESDVHCKLKLSNYQLLMEFESVESGMFELIPMQRLCIWFMRSSTLKLDWKRSDWVHCVPCGLQATMNIWCHCSQLPFIHWSESLFALSRSIIFRPR